MNTKQFGKGALPHVEDPRDYRFIGMAGVPFDWSKGYDVEEKAGKMMSENQGGSFSCGGSWAYYMGAQEAVALGRPYQRKSRKFAYSQAFVPGGGSDGRVLSEICVRHGSCQESLCSSYDQYGFPLTEAQYERPQDITQAARIDALKDKALYYGTVSSSDIDAVAAAIEANSGVMLGIYGKDNGTWLSADPLPPAVKASRWAHWVYAGKAGMRNGRKCIGIKNSWGDVGEDGWQWLSEDYFTSGNVWVCWTLSYDRQAFVIPKEIQGVLDKSRSPAWNESFLSFLRKFGVLPAARAKSPAEIANPDNAYSLRNTMNFLLSTLITFATGFLLAILPSIDTLGFHDIETGAYVGVLVTAARTGLKLAVQGIIEAMARKNQATN